MKLVSIRDVAREAGCSPAAVSFVLNHTRPVGDELRRRITRAAEKLGYELPPSRQKANTIALLADNHTTVCAGISLNELTDEIKRAGYDVQTFLLFGGRAEALPLLPELAASPGFVGVLNLLPALPSDDLEKSCPALPSLTPAQSVRSPRELLVLLEKLAR